MSRITDLSDAGLDAARANHEPALPCSPPSGEPASPNWLRKVRAVNAVLSIVEPTHVDVFAGKFSK